MHRTTLRLLVIAGLALLIFAPVASVSASTITISVSTNPSPLYAGESGQLTINSGGLHSGEIECNIVGRFNSPGSMTVPVNLAEGSYNIQCYDTATFSIASNIETVNVIAVTDTDGDGVPDHRDACPAVAGDIANQGCPIVPGATLVPPSTQPEGGNNGGVVVPTLVATQPSPLECELRASTTVNVRQSPSMDAEILTVIRGNVRYDMIEQTRVDGVLWFRIPTSSGSGWVSSTVVEYDPYCFPTDGGNVVDDSLEYCRDGEALSEYVQGLPDAISDAYTNVGDPCSAVEGLQNESVTASLAGDANFRALVMSCPELAMAMARVARNTSAEEIYRLVSYIQYRDDNTPECDTLEMRIIECGVPAERVADVINLLIDMGLTVNDLNGCDEIARANSLGGLMTDEQLDLYHILVNYCAFDPSQAVNFVVYAMTTAADLLALIDQLREDFDIPIGVTLVPATLNEEDYLVTPTSPECTLGSVEDAINDLANPFPEPYAYIPCHPTYIALLIHNLNSLEDQELAEQILADILSHQEDLCAVIAEFIMDGTIPHPARPVQIQTADPPQDPGGPTLTPTPTAPPTPEERPIISIGDVIIEYEQLLDPDLIASFVGRLRSDEAQNTLFVFRNNDPVRVIDEDMVSIYYPVIHPTYDFIAYVAETVEGDLVIRVTASPDENGTVPRGYPYSAFQFSEDDLRVLDASSRIAWWVDTNNDNRFSLVVTLDHTTDDAQDGLYHIVIEDPSSFTTSNEDSIFELIAPGGFDPAFFPQDALLVYEDLMRAQLVMRVISTTRNLTDGEMIYINLPGTASRCFRPVASVEGGYLYFQCETSNGTQLYRVSMDQVFENDLGTPIEFLDENNASISADIDFPAPGPIPEMFAFDNDDVIYVGLVEANGSNQAIIRPLFESETYSLLQLFTRYYD